VSSCATASCKSSLATATAAGPSIPGSSLRAPPARHQHSDITGMQQPGLAIVMHIGIHCCRRHLPALAGHCHHCAATYFSFLPENSTCELAKFLPQAETLSSNETSPPPRIWKESWQFENGSLGGWQGRDWLTFSGSVASSQSISAHRSFSRYKPLNCQITSRRQVTGDDGCYVCMRKVRGVGGGAGEYAYEVPSFLTWLAMQKKYAILSFQQT